MLVNYKTALSDTNSFSCTSLSSSLYTKVLSVFAEAYYNHFHNILRLFDVLPNFPFTTSETKRDY